METALWLILILVWLFAVAAAGLYGLVRYWQKQTQDDLRRIRSKLQDLGQEMRQVQVSSEPYTPGDPEPFRSLAEQLRSYMDQVEGQARSLAEQYASLRRDLPNPQPNDWRAYIRLPVDWYKLRQRTAAIRSGLVEADEQLNQAHSLVQQMDHQGWQTASLARKTMENIQSALRILSKLTDEDLQDQTLDASIQEGKAWEGTLRTRVPVYFFSAEESQVLAQADKDTIIHVHQHLAQAQPVVEDLVTKAHAWETQYEELKKVLNELAAGFRAVTNKFHELETHQVHPVVWDLSRQDLSNLRQRIEALGLSGKTRTFHDVHRDLEQGRLQLERQRSLTEHVGKVAAEHQVLIKLLETPEIRDGSDWLRSVHQWVEPLQTYDPVNWPNEDQAGLFPDELKRLSTFQEQTLVKNPSMPVNESDLTERVQELEQLAELHQSLRPRATRIQNRLTEIQETERNTHTAISRTRALLNQASALAGSNTFIDEIAGDEIENLRQELEDVTIKFEHPGEGILEKKVQTANDIIRRAEQAGNRWLEQFNNGLNEMKEELSKRMSVLGSIANLDEPAIQEAANLASTEPTSSGMDKRRPLDGLSVAFRKVEARYRTKSQVALADVISGLKQSNEEWQRSIVLLRSLEEIEQPLLERYDRAVQQRQVTSEEMNQAMEMIPEVLSWPPTTQNLAMERRQFQMLEDQWEKLKQEPVKAIHFVSRLSEMIERYQELSARVHQTIDHAEQEQQRVIELERHLDESSMLWKYQLNNYADNLFARDEIDNLLAEMEAGLDEIQQKYLRGTIQYNQVLHMMRGLVQQIDNAQVPVDNNQSIDINGVVQRQF